MIFTFISGQGYHTFCGVIVMLNRLILCIINNLMNTDLVGYTGILCPVHEHSVRGIKETLLGYSEPRGVSFLNPADHSIGTRVSVNSNINQLVIVLFL